MSSHIIICDIDKSTVDINKYNKLIEKINQYGSVSNFKDCIWIVSTNNITSEQIRDNLKPYLDTNDSIFVARLNGEGSWYDIQSNISKDTKDILDRTLEK